MNLLTFSCLAIYSTVLLLISEKGLANRFYSTKKDAMTKSWKFNTSSGE
jgi:hypothetical protein